LRFRVFVDEQKVPKEIEIDEFDEEALHYVAVDDKEVIGTLRIVDMKDAMRIGRLCVDRAYRHRRIATRLMDLALAHSKEEGATRVILDAQIDAIGFYEGFGFIAVGEPFDDGGIDHKRMTLDLPPG
jgi:predicted GNAT family N-acyltransferase